MSSGQKKLFGRERPLRDVLGGGKVAAIVLWRDKRLSAAILIAVTVVWLLFEVMEYNLLPLLCHISIAAMLLVFIWSNGAALLDLTPPKIPELILSEQAFRKGALLFHSYLSHSLSILHGIAGGNDLRLFLLTIISLWIISAIGNCCSSINLLFFVLLCALTLPALYERYEREVDHAAAMGIDGLQQLFKKANSKVLEKIPRGPAKANKSN
ncbi:reticulon-like protein B9 [Musa acuminata AAA Group]|uniref:reticulon-like protein B9 n=1 Tax=Musa acuminata AAA Group TaxID=214697 RepID=UPI0031DCDBD2